MRGTRLLNSRERQIVTTEKVVAEDTANLWNSELNRVIGKAECYGNEVILVTNEGQVFNLTVQEQ